MKKISLIFFLYCLFTPSVYAQETLSDSKTKPAEIDIEFEATSGINIEETSEIKFDFSTTPLVDLDGEAKYKYLPFREVKELYIEPSYRNLTMLYWKTGRLYETNQDHIDAFLFLTQCKKVKDFYYNDFKWERIRTLTEKYLEENKKHFSRKFKISQQLKLGVYDFEKKGFKIHNDYAHNNSKRFQVTNNSYKKEDFCFAKAFLREYLKDAPYNLILSVKDPFTFNLLPMSETFSELYLDYISGHYIKKVAYVVFYITLNLYKNTYYSGNLSGGYMIEYSGSIDYMEMYADKEETRLLYVKDYRSK